MSALTVVKNNLKFMMIRIKYNILAELKYPLNFVLQVIGMIFNNILIFATWFFVFSKFGSINGFDFEMMAGIYSISMISFGITYFLFGSITDIGRLIINNQIDLILTQPKDVLLQVISSKSDIVAFGDILVGLALFFLYYDIKKIPLFIISIICSTVIVSAFTIFAETLSFRYKYSYYTNVLLYNIMQNLAVYPNHIFPLEVRIITYTMFPAFFISFLPVNLLFNFDAAEFILLLTVSLIWFVGAYLFFYYSLKRYESGSSMDLIN